MGITNPASFLWRTTNVNWKEGKNGGANPGSISVDAYPVVELLLKLHKKRLDDNVISRDNPGVAIDANAIGYKHKSRPIASIYEVALAFAQKGIDVVVVFDGKSRHDSKRAAIHRRASIARKQVQLVELRSQLLAIGVGPDASEEDMAKVDEIGSKIRRLENEVAAGLPGDFASQVKSVLVPVSTQFTGKITTLVAPCQADPTLAALALRRRIEAIVTTDSDFAMYYVGPGADGLSDIMILPAVGGGKIKTCQLSTSQSACKDFIDGEGYSWHNQPKHPFFDGANDPSTRALLALAVGCDANPGGAHNFGPAKVKDFVGDSSTYDELVDKLSGSFGCKKTSCTDRHSHIKSPEAWRCLVDSMICEPTSVGALHSTPTEIGKFNKDYACLCHN